VSTDRATVPCPGRAPTASACEPHRELTTEALGRSRNAMAIWQDLVDDHGFVARSASVRRFVRTPRRASAGAYLNYTWYKLRVDADSETGVISVFVDDVYVGTWATPAPASARSGLTGLHSGNSGGAFDNFRIQPLRK